ncbi:MAG: hypothetical protein ABSB83_04485 [Methanomassiliicoccales archaeon]
MKDTAGFLRVRSSLLALLSLAGFGVVLSSSVGYDIEWVPPQTVFGLFGLVPLSFWLGIALIMLSMLLGIRSKNEHLFFLQALLLFVSIWGAPSFFERFPSVWDSYGHYQSVESVMRYGISGAGTTSYQFSYPGFFILSASYSSLGSPPVLLFLRFYPIFSSTLTLLALYLFTRTYIAGVDYRFALVVSMLADVWIQVHFSPESLGLAMGLLVFVFLEKDGLEWLLAAISAFAYVVISHPTTVLFVLGAIAIKEIIVRTTRLRRKWSYQRLEKPWPISIFLLMWISWLFTGAITLFTLQAGQIYSHLSFISNIPEALGGTVQQRAAENIFATSPQIRLFLLGSLVLLAGSSLAYYIFTRRRRDLALPANTIALFILPIIVVPLDLVLLGGQIYDRGILYLILGASMIITLVIVSRSRGILRRIIAVGVLIVVFLGMTTTFYQETLYVTSEESLKATEFLQSGMISDSVVVGGMIPPYIWGEHPSETFSRLGFTSSYPLTLVNLTGGVVPGALVFDRTSELWSAQYGYSYVYDFYINDALNYSKVYDSGAYWVSYRGATTL